MSSFRYKPTLLVEPHSGANIGSCGAEALELSRKYGMPCEFLFNNVRIVLDAAKADQEAVNAACSFYLKGLEK